MRKHEELSNPASCLNKANPSEMLFVLMARDPEAPAIIEAWCVKRIASGKNKEDDKQIIDAMACAQAMREERARNTIA